MSNRVPNEHLSAELLQALLEGDLPDREAARAEEHLGGCVRCSSELDAWRVLIEDLDGLATHRPTPGFADRVLAGVSPSDALPLAARVRESVTIHGAEKAHVDDALLQEYLDGALGRRKAASIEEHLAACSPCSDEADAWSELLVRLEGLDRFAPRDGFARRVMRAVDLPEPMPLAARIRRSTEALMPPSAAEHLDSGLLQELVDGDLLGRRLTRVHRHLDGCALCSAELLEWQGLDIELQQLQRFAPTEGFADRVMERVAPAPLVVAEPAPSWSSVVVTTVRAGLAGVRALGPRALAVARRMLPRSKRSWAAISGVAVTPATIGGLMLYAVFSHPTLTIGSLASFVWWQLTDLATAGMGAASAVFLQSGELLGLSSLFGSLASAPLVVACGVLAYSLVSAFAARVLYRNIISTRPLGGRYAHLSTS